MVEAPAGSLEQVLTWSWLRPQLLGTLHLCTCRPNWKRMGSEARALRISTLSPSPGFQPSSAEAPVLPGKVDLELAVEATLALYSIHGLARPGGHGGGWGEARALGGPSEALGRPSAALQDSSSGGGGRATT